MALLLMVLAGGAAAMTLGRSHHADAGTRSDSEALGIRIDFDGRSISDAEIGTAVAQIRLVAKAKGIDLDEQGIDERAATSAAFGAALRQRGMEVGPMVTEQEITDAILNSSVVGSIYDIADVASGSEGGRDPVSIVKDSTYRTAMESILYRNRGLASFANGDGSTVDPAAQDRIRAWFAAAIVAHGIEASTPFGKVENNKMVSGILGVD